VIWPVLEVFRRLDGRIFAYYLMQDYAFTAQFGGAYPPELNQRLKKFGQKVTQAMAENWDEVLIVGHSSGAHSAVSVLAELGRCAKIKRAPVPVGFLSLGHVIPMVNFLPRAAGLRCAIRLRSAAWRQSKKAAHWLSWRLLPRTCRPSAGRR